MSNISHNHPLQRMEIWCGKPWLIHTDPLLQIHPKFAENLFHRFSCNMILVLCAGALCSECKEAFKSRTQLECEMLILTFNTFVIDDFVFFDSFLDLL